MAASKERGVTLIETLIYLALFAIMIGGVVATAYLLLESSDRNQTKAMMQEEKNFLLSTIDRALSGAKIICAPAVNTSGRTLSVVEYGSDGACPGLPDISITLTNGSMTWNGSTLNNSNVTITHLIFVHTYNEGTSPEGIEAGFTISARTPGGFTIAQSGTTTRYLRK